MVAGTGHDFMGRHSCSDAIFIRTSLLKDIKPDKINEIITLGAGVVFSEAHKAAAEADSYVVSGWATTVGVVGWAIGGGHGPFAPGKGTGVDNIVAANIVTADGSLITVNATSEQYKDLFWAIRGGGGSAWGIFTSITYRMHPMKNLTGNRFGFLNATFKGNMCNES
jgi:FAD/FMN-containing dehydrogenase